MEPKNWDSEVDFPGDLTKDPAVKLLGFVVPYTPVN